MPQEYPQNPIVQKKQLANSQRLEAILFILLVSMRVIAGGIGLYAAFSPSYDVLAPINQYFNDLLNTHTVWLVISVIGAVIFYKVLAASHYLVVDINRSKTHQQWAYRHRWKYKANKDQELYRRYRFLEGLLTQPSKLSQAKYPCAVHSFQRRWKSYSAIAYTRYSKIISTSKNGPRSRSTKVSRYFQAVTLIHTQGHFPTLLIYPYGWTDRLFGLITGLVTWIAPHPRTFVTLTDQKSGKKYQISADDSTVIEQFSHAEMMTYLFANPGLEIKLGKDAIALYQKGRLKPKNIERNLEHLHQIYTLLPLLWKSDGNALSLLERDTDVERDIDD